jgi:KDO2-lipid IV(A) lauroyltransferase
VKALLDLLVAGLALLLGIPLLLLPWRAALAVGRLYGYVLFLVYPAGRRTAMINLRRFRGPSLSRGQARSWTWRCCGLVGQGLAEAIQFARRFGRGQPGWEALYVAEDPDLEARLLADPRPKVFVTGHLGSWEITGMLLARRLGGKGAALARAVDNPYVEALLSRLRPPGQVIEKRGGAGQALARLEAGESVMLLLDENGGWRGPFVPFLGRLASTRKTAALLAVRTGAPLVLGAAVRRPGPAPFLYRLAVIEPGPSREISTPRLHDLTAQLVRTYESWVREDPPQWRWLHWRWKTRPDGTEESYGRRDLARAFAEGA